MRASMRWTSAVSPRWKNMPSLVRSALTSSPPVAVATVSERAMRGRAASISAVHSSGESRLPSSTTRGCARAMSTSTVQSPTSMRVGAPCSAGAGRFVAGVASGEAAVAVSEGKASSAAWRATWASQPAWHMASTRAGKSSPSAARSAIHARSAGVMGWRALMAVPRGETPGARGKMQRGGRRSPPGRSLRAGVVCWRAAGWPSVPSGRARAWRRS